MFSSRLSEPSPLMWWYCMLRGLPRHVDIPQISHLLFFSPSLRRRAFRWLLLVRLLLTNSFSIGIAVGRGTTAPRFTALCQASAENPNSRMHSRLERPLSYAARIAFQS